MQGVLVRNELDRISRDIDTYLIHLRGQVHRSNDLFVQIVVTQVEIEVENERHEGAQTL